MKTLTTFNFLIISLLFSLSNYAQDYSWHYTNATGDGCINVLDSSENVYAIGIFPKYQNVDFNPGPGSAIRNAIGTRNVYIQKMDSNMVFQWVRSFGANGNVGTYVHDAVYDSNGYIYITGQFNGTGDFDGGAPVQNLTSSGFLTYDAYIAKLDLDGNLIWIKQIGGTQNDSGYHLDVADDGSVYVIGSYTYSIDFDPGPGTHLSLASNTSQDYILKLDAAGNFSWVFDFDPDDMVICRDINVDNSGNVIVVGDFEGTIDFDPGPATYNLSTFGTWHDPFMLKLDENGNFIFAKRYAGKGFNDSFFNVLTNSNNEIITNGIFWDSVDFDPDGSGMIFDLANSSLSLSPVIKMDSNGIIEWVAPFVDCLGDIAISPEDSIFLYGEFSDSIDVNPNLGLNNFLYTPSSSIFHGYVVEIDNNGNYLTSNKLISNAKCQLHDMSFGANGALYYSGFTNGVTDFDVNPTSANDTSANSAFVAKYNGCAGLPGISTNSSCNSFTWIDGNTYTSSNYSATHTLTNSQGCDSIVILDLTINSNSGVDVISSCFPYTWIDGNTYSASNNTAAYVLTNVSGCDSTVMLNLSINSSEGTDTIFSCNSYTWIDGNTYSTSNNSATHILPNSAGCDSTITLDLTISQSTSGTDIVNACNSYTWIDGNTYTSSNSTATFTLQNSAGCDSVVTLNLNLSTLAPAGINVSGGTLFANNQSISGYEWYDCDANQLISGATNSQYTPVINGNYAVIMYNGSCVDTSACEPVLFAEIEALNDHINIFPNPFHNELTVDFGNNNFSGEIVIFDAIGNLVLQQSVISQNTVQINLDIESGLYYFTASDKTGKFVNVKLTKH